MNRPWLLKRARTHVEAAARQLAEAQKLMRIAGLTEAARAMENASFTAVTALADAEGSNRP